MSYEQERDRLIQTLPEASVKDRALVDAQGPSPDRRENDVRELAALVAQPQ